jgi:ATP synthase protein I
MLKEGVFAMTTKDSDDKKEGARAMLAYSSLGIEMGLSVVIGIGIGYYLDSYFGTKPVLTIIFMFLGIIAGFRRLYMIWKALDKEDKQKRDRGY